MFSEYNDINYRSIIFSFDFDITSNFFAHSENEISYKLSTATLVSVCCTLQQIAATVVFKRMIDATGILIH